MKYTLVTHRKKSLARCGKCRKAFYCDVKCQVGSEFWSDLKLIKPWIKAVNRFIVHVLVHREQTGPCTGWSARL